MRIQYFTAEDWQEPYVREKLPDDDITFHTGPIDAEPELTDTDAEALCIFIDSKVGKEELERFPNVKLIATRSTGFDHIDLEAVKERDITVMNVPSYGEHTVAEFAFSLILALSRRVIDADEAVREAGTFVQDGLRGFDLRGKTLGIIGCGHIGMHAIAMGNGFGMHVLGFDVHQDPDLAEKNHFEYASLDDLLARSDIVSIHVPHNPHTHHLLNKENMPKMKKGAYLINTARGAIVDTDALVEVLKSETLAGAGLDVLESEGELSDPLELLTAPHPNQDAIRDALADHYLIHHPRVIVTPHVAFDTDEAVRRIIDTTVGNIKNFTSGEPKNAVGA